jgi:hypothetical protein
MLSEIDRAGLKILENNKNIQSIISVNTNILLRRFRLKFLKIIKFIVALCDVFWKIARTGRFYLEKYHPVTYNLFK